MYKYVVIDYNTRQPKCWEEGINRICDPEYIPRVSEFDSGTLQPIQDEWEHFTVTFSIYLPLTGDDPTAQYLRINGGTPRLGEWNKGEGPIVMVIGPSRKWLTGEYVKPWEHARVRFSHSMMPERLIYKYSIYDRQ